MMDRPRIRCPGCRAVVRVTADGLVPDHRSPADTACRWGQRTDLGVVDTFPEFVVGTGSQQALFGGAA